MIGQQDGRVETWPSCNWAPTAPVGRPFDWLGAPQQPPAALLPPAAPAAHALPGTPALSGVNQLIPRQHHCFFVGQRQVQQYRPPFKTILEQWARRLSNGHNASSFFPLFPPSRGFFPPYTTSRPPTSSALFFFFSSLHFPVFSHFTSNPSSGSAVLITTTNYTYPFLEQDLISSTWHHHHTPSPATAGSRPWTENDTQRRMLTHNKTRQNIPKDSSGGYFGWAPP